MRGLNKVIVAGHLMTAPEYGRTGKSEEVCGFYLSADRHSQTGLVVANVKINVYQEWLVRQCRKHLTKGSYAMIDGELMNRDGPYGPLTEIRAREIMFFQPGDDDAKSGGA